ncbi:septation protein IspZ [Sphingomonas sp. SUN039]|uniref:septation protein IspZ n=1 Tax=Sphingomonas sp. SUN039 TaxID=2937787 RepID=UPI0021648050|nr:septation protein IspZ [Sphingomonas sp. SUN039]UVO53827.1 septation protein IspZ [Sphingomonas sp. SUN039]
MSDVKPKSAGNLGLLLDYGPLIAFFIGYKIWGVFAGTGVFMAAMIVALVVSKWKLGRIAPMLWISAILIIGFGALTIWFHDPSFIQKKPTIIYAGLGVLLLGGAMLGKPLLKYVLEAGFEGLHQRAWLVLSRNWGLFFFAMAVLNEILVRQLSFDTWLSVKVWALIPLSMAFGIAHVPYMMKNGLGGEAEVPPAS